jgi:hypothetical protein
MGPGLKLFDSTLEAPVIHSFSCSAAVQKKSKSNSSAVHGCFFASPAELKLPRNPRGGDDDEKHSECGEDGIHDREAGSWPGSDRNRSIRHIGRCPEGGRSRTEHIPHNVASL